MKAKLIVGAAFIAFAWASLAAHDWWVAKQAVVSEAISRRDREIAVRDARIRVRDAQLQDLARRDSLLRAQAARQTAAHAADRASWEARSRALAADTRDMMPMPEVRALQLAGAVALESCETLGATKDQRISTLEEQLLRHAENRAELDTNRVAADSTRAEVVALLRPPWWKRSFSWLQDHAVTLAIGGAGGFILAKAP